MKVRAAFIGINKYRSPSAPDLTGASLDATAMWALFSDTFPDAEAARLIDEQATCSAVQDLLHQTLKAAESDDIVIVTFSGHGSDVSPLRATCIAAASVVL